MWRLGQRALCVILITTIVLTWLVGFPVKEIAHLLQRRVDYGHFLEGGPTWIQRYEELVNKAVLREDMYRPNTSENVVCGRFPESFEENLQTVLNYSFNISSRYLEMLQLDGKGITDLVKRKVKSSVPVFATASSANHFSESQALVKDIHEKVIPKYKNIKFIYYDIGLQKGQLELLKKHCTCEVRTFSFEDYPDHVRKLQGYTWKPIIIQTLLREFDFVMWMDASVRFFGTPLDSLFLDASHTGIKLVPGGGSIAVRTHSNTFNTLGERPCMFHWPELEATWMIVRRTMFTLNAVMRPWVSCALQAGCMAQPSARLSCPAGRSQKFGSCHRFDQSVIGIIMTRLFNYKVQLAHFKISEYGTIRRENRSNYLVNLDKTQ